LRQPQTRFGDLSAVYPVSSSYLSSVFQQNGRSFLGDITVAYP